MSTIWHGADPASVVDVGAYELGSVVGALEAVTLNGIRVWSPANAVTRTNRRGHVWDAAGTLLATIVMTDALASGWTTHLLDTPMSLSAGDIVVISYESSGNYGATAAALASAHIAADAAMMFPQSAAVLVAGSSTTGNGRYSTTPATAPNSSFNHTFYGVDADYTVAGAGTAPTVTGLVLTASGLSVTAVITATDPDGLTGATYAIDWGDSTTSSGATASFAHTYSGGGVKAILATVTDSTGLDGSRAGAIELVAASSGVAGQAILDAIVSHAMALGLFERVNGHEPENAPGAGLTCAVWVQDIGPVPAGSGLRATTARLAINVRLYTSMLSEPADAIDPNMLAAADALMSAYSGDFTLGGLVRNVDLLGQAGAPLGAQAGYIQQDEKLLRVMTINLPVIINDVWEQAP